MIVTIFLLLFGKIVQDASMVMVMDDDSFCVRVCTNGLDPCYAD